MSQALLSNKTLNSEKILTYACSFTLLIFSLLLYKERIIFVDNANYMMEMVKGNNFALVNYRFISIFTQTLPLVALHLHVPLNIVIASYSINLILLPILLSLISIYWFKESRTAISILLLYLLLNINLFYLPVSELQMALCFLLFYNGFYDYYLKKEDTNKWIFYSISGILIFIIVFNHPLSILIFVSWSLWKYIDFDKNLYKALALILFAFISYLIKYFFYNTDYETEKTDSLKNFKTISINDFSENLPSGFFTNLFTNNFLVPIILLITFTALIYYRKFLLLFLFTACLIGFWLLPTISFKNYNYNCYSEHLYQPVTFFVVIAFTYYGLPLFKNKWLISLLILSVFSISLIKIYEGKKELQERHSWYKGYLTLMKQNNINKGVISRVYLNKGGPRDTYWNSSNEILLLSSLDGPKESMSLFVPWDINTHGRDLKQKDKILADGWDIPQNEFPSSYFQFSNDSYTDLEASFDKTLLENIANN